MAECIDLRTLGRFKVVPGEDHHSGTTLDIWNLEIPCSYGKIYPHGGTRLQAYCDNKNIRPKLEALPCVKIHQKGDWETTVIFDVEDLSAVAGVLKAYKKPKGGKGRTKEELEAIRPVRKGPPAAQGDQNSSPVGIPVVK